MTTKAVFLDIDGVILPIGACTDVDAGLARSAPSAHLDLVASRVSMEAVECAAGLGTYAGAKIVLISSWRHTFSHAFIESFLKAIGLGPHLHEDWFAPFRFSSGKAHDIADWLGDHPEVKASFAIDDHDLRLDGVRQIRPADSRVGLTKSDMSNAACAWGMDELLREATGLTK